MPYKPLFIALIGLLLAASAQAQAQWKWRDAKGNLQYSDKPPPAGTPDKDVLQRPIAARPTILVAPTSPSASSAASAPAQAASAPTKAELEAAAQQKKQQDTDAAKRKEEERRLAELRRENCVRARATLRELQSGKRLTRTNDDGERVYMDQSQIAGEVSRAQDVITSECR